MYNIQKQIVTCVIFGFILRVHSVLQDTPEALVLNLNKETWGNAADFCSQGNGTLLSVENNEKLEALIRLDKTPLWKNQISTTDVWFGLYGDGRECDVTKYSWHGKGTQENWFHWHDFEPDYCHEHNCVRISKFLWRTRQCDVPYPFVCEYKLEACQFELLQDVRMTAVTVNQTLKDTNLNSCLSRCQIAVQQTLKCWVVEIIEQKPSECTLIFTDDKYLADNTSNIIMDKDSCLIAKRCTIALPSTGNAKKPFLLPNTTTEETELTLSPTSTFDGLLTSVHHYSESVISMMTLSHLAASSTRSDIYASHIDKFYCIQTMSNVSAEELQAEIKRLQQELTILKNGTSLHRRRLVSVYETRVSAVGMGLVSSVILIVILVAVIVSDFPVFYRQIRYFNNKIGELDA